MKYQIISVEDSIDGSNIKLGTNALKKNQNGKNVALGHKSLENNIDGYQNTSVGAYSLGRNQASEAINNTALGFKSIQNNLSGKYNTAIGALSGKTLQTGSKNVILGKHADVSSKDAMNQIVIGQGAVGLSDNSVTLGNDNVNNVFMSEARNANLHCGVLTIYDDKGRKSYSLPDSDGNPNQVLQTDGNGILSFATVRGGGGGASSLNDLSDCTIELLNKNMFFGENVGANNTPGDEVRNYEGKRNTALGIGSFSTNTTGKFNVCFGSDSLNANITGNYNAAMGHNSLTTNTEGSYNVAIGHASLMQNTTGNANTATGMKALNYTTGNNNTALGFSSGSVITTGSDNVIIGVQAGPSVAAASNQIVIGKGATGVTDDSVTLGNADVTAVYMAQNSGATVHCGGLNIGETAVTSTAAELNFVDGVTSNIQTQLDAKQPTLTFGKSSGNTLKSEEALTTDDVLLMGTNNVKGRTYNELKSDLNLNNVENTAISTFTGSSNITTTGAINSGSITSGFGNIDNGASNITTTGTITGGTVNATTLQIGGTDVTATAAELNILDGLTSIPSSINDLSDTLVQDSGNNGSIYIGNDPSGNTDYSNANGNVALGLTALSSITTGDYNVAVGQDALKANTTGCFNTASGFRALYFNITGSRNTASGYYAIYKNTTGYYNTASGYDALYENTTGYNNTASGYGTLLDNTTGNNNTALGYIAGDKITTGSNNVIIGSGADPSVAAASNQIVIGQGASGQANNSVTLGNTNVTAVRMAQNSGATVYCGGLNIGGTTIGLNQSLLTTDTPTFATPTSNGHAANKDYVDTVAQGLGIKSAVKLATTTNGTLSTNYANGQYLDGIELVTGYRILIKDQADASENGIYIVTSGAPTRASDFDDGSEVIGTFFFVEQGTVNGNNGFVCTNAGSVTIGTTDITFTQFSGAGQITTGTGLRKTNNEIKFTGGLNDLSNVYVSGEDNNGSIYIGKDPSSNTGFSSNTGNVAIGLTALDAITTGAYNVATGQDALTANTTGCHNTASGYQSLKANTTGSDNVSIGYQSGNTLETGSNNVIIGKNSDVNSNSATNQIVIGKGATGVADNSVTLGNTDVTAVYMSQDSGATVFCKGLTNTAGDGLQLLTNNGTAEKILIKNQQGTAADSIKLESTAGGITLASATTLSSTLTIADGTNDFNIASHDGTTYGLKLEGTLVTSTAAELNILDGVTSTAAELNILDGVTSTAAELNLVDGSSSGTVVNNKAVIYGSNGEVNASTLQIGGTAISLNDLSDCSALHGNINLELNSTSNFSTLTGDGSTSNPYTAASTIQGRNNGIATISFKVIADGEVDIEAVISSEVRYDLGYIQINGANIWVSSGNNIKKNFNSYSVNQGDIITFKYTKDGNTHLHQDKLVIKINTTNSTYNNKIAIGQGATGVANNSVTLGNSNITAVYMAQDSGATVHCAGLNIGETALTSTAAELNLVDGSSSGTVVNSKAVIYGSNGEVNASKLQIGGTAVSLNNLNDVKILSSTGSGDTYKSGSTYIGNDPSGNDNYSDSSAIGNLAVGLTALDAITTGEYNTAIGQDALSTNNEGSNNTAIGYTALYSNISGNANTASGWGALYSNTSGSQNTSSGYNALRTNTTGIENTASGYQALYSNVTGCRNTAIGNKALMDNTASFNTALGLEALKSNTTGCYNTASGCYSLSNNNTGNNNIALGHQAGDLITTGSDNVIIGFQADPSAATASNQIVIGKGVTGVADNSVTLGNDDVTAVYMAQDKGATVHCGGLNIGETAVTSTAAELNLLDDSSSGTIVNNKAVIYGSNGEVNASTLQIGGTAISLNDLSECSSGPAQIEYNSASRFGTLTGDGTASDPFTATSNVAWNAIRVSATISFKVIASGEVDMQAVIISRGSHPGHIQINGTDIWRASGYQTKNFTSYFVNQGDIITFRYSKTNSVTGNQGDKLTIKINATDNSSVITLGNANVNRIYMAQDSGATVHCGGAVFYGDSTNGAGSFVLNCENNSHGVTIKGPPHSAAADYTLTLPNDDGEEDQVLTTDGSGVLSWTSVSEGTSSDKRLKEDIQTTKLGLDFINKLNPVSYKWNNDKQKDKRDHEGLIAQEVEIVINELGLTKDNHALVNYEESEDKYRLVYTELIGPLIKAVQELTERVKELESQNN